MSCGPCVTEDRLLGGRVLLRQPARGYRAAVDPLLLAAAVPAGAGARVLDLGCGPGAAALALLARVPDAHVTGVEIEPEIAALARENAGLNARPGFEVLTGDAGGRLPGSVDHVMMNPPYHAAGAQQAPPDAAKARAHLAPAGETARWIAAGLRALRAGGTLTVIQKAEHLGAILTALEGRAGRIVVQPIHPRADAPANRVLVQAVLGRRTPLRLLPPLVLHAGAALAPQVEALLRDGVALPLD